MPFVYKVMIYGLIVWSLITSVLSIRLVHSNIKLRATMHVLHSNQEKIASMIDALADNQVTIVDLHKSNVEMYNNVRAYLRRFNSDAKMVEETRNLIKDCRNEDQTNP